MSDSNQSDDIRKKLGLAGGASNPPSGQSGVIPPPAIGSNIPPPAIAGGAIPAPFLGRPQLDVAPPPFLAKKKEKKVRKIIEEVYEDVGPVIDPKAAALRRKLITISIIVAIPAFFCMFYVGKSRQDWALNDRSRADAAKLLTAITKAQPILEQVQTKTNAALTKAKAGEVDTGYLEFTRDISESRPISNNDVDMLNYAAFDPQTVDMGFQFSRLTDSIWSEMSVHRGITKTDLNALQSANKLGVPRTQTSFGVLLVLLDAETLGANVGVVSNPGVNDEGAATLDLQVRAGRRAHSFKVYSKGAFGEKVNEWVIPVDPSQSAADGPLSESEKSHFVHYTERLEGISKTTREALDLQGILQQKLQSISGG